ncbi:hypothetical protein RDV78_02400 [Bacillota bacterium LX-D]|nr:hypothetical protein [Bacillota bacterium LX-D]
MEITRADNAQKGFKCGKCGYMFSGVQDDKCPVCGFKCTSETCTVVDYSDEDY